MGGYRLWGTAVQCPKSTAPSPTRGEEIMGENLNEGVSWRWFGLDFIMR